MRLSVHSEKDREKDLGGRYALLSDHFWYFGNRPLPLPDDLRGIVKNGPGHRSKSNAPYVEMFLEWLRESGLEPNKLYGKAQVNLFRDTPRLRVRGK